MVAAVAVGDLFAHVVVCGVEFGFLVLARFLGLGEDWVLGLVKFG